MKSMKARIFVVALVLVAGGFALGVGVTLHAYGVPGW